MRRIAEERDRTLAPASEWRAVVERPFLPLRRGLEEVVRRRVPRPGRKAIEQFRPRASGGPAGLLPVVTQDGDDVDHAPGLDRIVHEMGAAPEPEVDRGRREAGGRGVGRNQSAPGDVARKALLRATVERSAQDPPEAFRSHLRPAALLRLTRT